METLFENGLSNPDHYQEDYVHRVLTGSRDEEPPVSLASPAWMCMLTIFGQAYATPGTCVDHSTEMMSFANVLGILRGREHTTTTHASGYYVSS
jgi:hypothetical protein